MFALNSTELICEELDDEDDDSDDDLDVDRIVPGDGKVASVKAAPKRLSELHKSLASTSIQGVQSCPTGSISTIQAVGSHEFKSAADQLFGVRGPLDSQVAS